MSDWVPSHTSKYRTCSMSAVIHVRSWTWCPDTETVSGFSNRFYIFWALVIILSSKDEIFLIRFIYLEVWVFPEERGVILTLWAPFSSSLGSVEAKGIALLQPLTFIPLFLFLFPNTRRSGQMLGMVLWIKCILTEILLSCGEEKQKRTAFGKLLLDNPTFRVGGWPLQYFNLYCCCFWPQLKQIWFMTLAACPVSTRGEQQYQNKG